MTLSMKLKLTIFIVFLSTQGCMYQTYYEEPINVTEVIEEINSWSISNPYLNRFLKLNGVVPEIIQTNIFSINRLFLTGIYYDPEMQTAYKKWKKSKIVLGNSDYKINPEFFVPLEHHSDTSGGESEWTIGLVLSFIYERKGKREARIAKKKIKLLNLSLEIYRLALDRYGLFKEKYHAYALRQAKITEIENGLIVLKDLFLQLQYKYELGAVSQIELNSTRLELQRSSFELSLQENKLQENKDELLMMTNLVHSELDTIEIETTEPLLFAKTAYEEMDIIGSDLSELQKMMMDNNLDMAIELNDYAQSEAGLRLEIEKQYPNLVLSPGFIFDQTDNLWSLGTSWVLPLFENSKEMLSSLYQRYHSVVRHKSLIKISDNIIVFIEQRTKELEKQMEIGGIDSIAMMRNKIEFYKARNEQIDIYKEATYAILEFKHLLKSVHSEIHINDIVTSWLKLMEERSDNELVN
jgi:cobalt-zinc-cadmium efflux system outer membrane protein